MVQDLATNPTGTDPNTPFKTKKSNTTGLERRYIDIFTLHNTEHVIRWGDGFSHTLLLETNLPT